MESGIVDEYLIIQEVEALRGALDRIIELSSADVVSTLVDQRGNSSLFGAQDFLIEQIAEIREEAVRALREVAL